MPKVRIDKSLKETLKNFLDDSDEWSKQSEFVNQAIREKLDREKSSLESLTEEELKMLKKLADKELD